VTKIKLREGWGGQKKKNDETKKGIHLKKVGRGVGGGGQ